MFWIILYLNVGWICSTIEVIDASVKVAEEKPEYNKGLLLGCSIALSILLAPLWPMLIGLQIYRLTRKRGVQQSD